MEEIFRKYNDCEHYLKIRDFIVSTYKIFNRPYNWLIERWNFCRHYVVVMHSNTKEWEDTIGIWEDINGNILAVVHSEGEESGEVFFEVGTTNITKDLLEEMFEFAENNLSIKKNCKQFIQLRIPDCDKQREHIAASRGYEKLSWSETTSVISIEDRQEGRLPKGFTIKEGSDLSDEVKGEAHAKAFGYFDNKEHAEKSPSAYNLIKKAPDYRSDLDLYVISESGEVASFCTMWFDETNKIGILEPVGTNPNYRKMGLGRAVIGEALRRIALEGATKAYVGSAQDFYTSIGFQKEYKYNVWEKVLNE